MYKYFKISETVINDSVIMEADTISRNGLRLKTKMSRGNLFAYIIFGSIFFPNCASITYLSNGYGIRYTTSVNSFGDYNLITDFHV